VSSLLAATVADMLDEIVQIKFVTIK